MSFRRELRLVEKPADRDDEIYRIAVESGCRPIWRDGIIGWAWHCGCPDLAHAADQQCSVISPESALRGAGT